MNFTRKYKQHRARTELFVLTFHSHDHCYDGGREQWGRGRGCSSPGQGLGNNSKRKSNAYFMQRLYLYLCILRDLSTAKEGGGTLHMM